MKTLKDMVSYFMPKTEDEWIAECEKYEYDDVGKYLNDHINELGIAACIEENGTIHISAKNEKILRKWMIRVLREVDSSKSWRGIFRRKHSDSQPIETSKSCY